MPVGIGGSRDPADDRARASPPAAPAPPPLVQPPTKLPPPPPQLPHGFVPVALGSGTLASSPSSPDLAASDRIAPPPPSSASPRRPSPPRPCDARGVCPVGPPSPTSPVPRSGRPTLRSIVVVPPALRGEGRPRDEEGWLTVPPRRRPAGRSDGGGVKPKHSAAAIRFMRRTEGLCARCLAPIHHHRSSACRAQIRCLSCNLSGHKERDFPLRRATKSAHPGPAYSQV